MMKRAIYFSLLSVILLTGCSDQVGLSAQIQSTTVSEIPSSYSGYVLNPQVTDDRSLQEEGQTFRDNKGELTLKTIIKDGRIYEIGPIELTVRETKILHFQPETA